MTSPAHPALRLARELGTPRGRKEKGLVLLEGLRAAETAVAAGARVEAAFFTPAALAEERPGALARRLLERGGTVFQVGSQLFRGLTQVERPQGIALICAPPRVTLDEALKAAYVLVADRVQDPGNLGNLLRTARAFGVEAVVTTKGSTEAANPKAVRAAAGAWPGLKLAESVPGEQLAEALRRGGFTVLVADPRGQRDYRDAPWDGKVALVMGSETRGADPALRHGATLVRIPQAPEVESLNVATASAVLLAEAYRRRGPAARASKRFRD